MLQYTVTPFSCNGREIFVLESTGCLIKQCKKNPGYKCELKLRLYHTVKLITQVDRFYMI